MEAAAYREQLGTYSLRDDSSLASVIPLPSASLRRKSSARVLWYSVQVVLASGFKGKQQLCGNGWHNICHRIWLCMVQGAR